MLCQAQDASCRIPLPLSLEGDVHLILDDGSTMSAHSLYLSHASAVFKTALSCAGTRQTTADDTDEDEQEWESVWSASAAAERTMTSHSKRPKVMAKLPLPGATRRQAQLLVQALYCFKRDSWADSLAPPELIDLAAISDKFSCVCVLQLADEALVKKTASETATGWLTVLDAPGQFELAHRLHLTSYEAHVGQFLGRHARKVDLTRLDARSAAILEGACSII